MRTLMQKFQPWHAWTAVFLWAVFSLLTLWIVVNGLDNASERPGRVLVTTLGTILGPMTGAISRDFQQCCLEASLSLLPYCLGGLLIGVVVQIVVPARPVWRQLLRVVFWLGGLVVWFGGGIVSFAHALS